MERLYEEAKDNQSIILILDELKKKAEDDLAFAEKLNNEKKSVKEMMLYIQGEAVKQKNDNAAVISSYEVFGWAIHYFDEEIIEINNINHAVKVDNAAPRPLPVKKSKNKINKEDFMTSLFDYE